MRIAFIHYHARTGGVTRIIEHTMRILDVSGCSSGLLTGEPVSSETALSAVAVMPELAYGEARVQPEILAARAREEARRLLGGPPDVWHFHNHHLGKNLAMPLLAKALADAGEAVVLQVHDFPEDGRPGNYRFLKDGLGASFEQALYPVGRRLRYAVLNGRDGRILRTAGMAASEVVLLPNPIVVEPAASSPVPAELGRRRLMLYPTRAIRRKNIGELLLHAARSSDKDLQWGVTRAPRNPAEQVFYQRWPRLAAELHLPVHFEMGSEYAYHTLLAAADTVVTTSIAEGFGLAFLEPWLMGHPLTGRNLPDITADFNKLGIRFPDLYTRLDVPLEQVGETAFRDRLAQGLSTAREAYGLPCGNDEIERAWRAAVTDDRVDFGCLDEALQEKVVRSQGAGDGERRTMSEEPETLVCRGGKYGKSRFKIGPQAPISDSESITSNATLIREHFNLEAYGRKLMRVYERCLSGGEEQKINPATVLAEFTAPERFRLLRT